MYKDIIKKNLNNCLVETNFTNLGKKIDGKVRDIYDIGEKMVLITTDRQSAFDRVLASIPFKGQVLNQVSQFWFEQTKDIIDNAIIDFPDPNVVVAKKCKVFPVEFVMRCYMTGVTSTSVWTAYSHGEREFCGNILPEGLVKNQKFDQPMITPTTKAEDHDEKISPKQIVERGLMSQEDWDFVSAKSIEIFNRGTKIAEQNGLILVDTKYEFGTDSDGNILLIDEVHTPDSSRYWLKDSYKKRIKEGLEPENIDKEFLRLWFKENCDPYGDKEIPEAPDDLVIELSSRYIKLYEMITGKKFVFPENNDNIIERIKKNLNNY